MSKDKKSLLTKVLMGGSLATVLLATLGWLGIDIWLASTQWLLVGAIFALFGIYIKLEG